MSNKIALQRANVRTSCISLRTPATNKHSQHTENSRLEPAIRDAQKLAQNVFPPWIPYLSAFPDSTKLHATFGDRVFILVTGNKHKIQRWRDAGLFPDVFVFSDFKVCSHYLHALRGNNLIQQSFVTLFCFFSCWHFDRKLFFTPTIFTGTY